MALMVMSAPFNKAASSAQPFSRGKVNAELAQEGRSAQAHKAVRPAVDATLPQLLLGKVAGGRMGYGPRQYSRTVCATVTENLI
jgi:hypothetical protein